MEIQNSMFIEVFTFSSCTVGSAGTRFLNRSGVRETGAEWGKIWDALGWDGLGWDCLGWNGLGWFRMVWDGMIWDCLGWDGLGWDGLE